MSSGADVPTLPPTRDALPHDAPPSSRPSRKSQLPRAKRDAGKVDSDLPPALFGDASPPSEPPPSPKPKRRDGRSESHMNAVQQVESVFQRPRGRGNIPAPIGRGDDAGATREHGRSPSTDRHDAVVLITELAPEGVDPARVKELEKKVAELTEKLARAERERDEDGVELGRMVAKISEQQQVARTAERRIALLEETIAATKAEAASSIELLDKARERAQGLEAKLKAAHEKIAGLEREAGEAESLYAETVAELESEQDRNRASTRELERLQAALAQVHDALAADRAARASREEQLTLEIERLRSTQEVPSAALLAARMQSDDDTPPSREPSPTPSERPAATDPFAHSGAGDMSIDDMLDSAMDAIRVRSPHSKAPPPESLRATSIDVDPEARARESHRAPSPKKISLVVPAREPTPIERARYARHQLEVTLQVAPDALDELRDHLTRASGEMAETGPMLDAIQLGELQTGDHDDMDALNDGFDELRARVDGTAKRLKMLHAQLPVTAIAIDEAVSGAEEIPDPTARASRFLIDSLSTADSLVDAMDLLAQMVGAYATGGAENVRKQRGRGAVMAVTESPTIRNRPPPLPK